MSEGQSELTTHSGRQATYGSPKYSGRHWQAAALFLSLHTALEPHGEGLQGSIGLVTGDGATKKRIIESMKNKFVPIT